MENTSVYESSVLGRVLIQQLRQLQKEVLSDCLLGDAQDSPLLSQCLGPGTRIGQVLQHNGQRIGMSEVVFFTGQAAVVRACAQLLGGSLALVCDMLVRIKGAMRTLFGELQEVVWRLCYWTDLLQSRFRIAGLSRATVLCSSCTNITCEKNIGPIIVLGITIAS